MAFQALKVKTAQRFTIGGADPGDYLITLGPILDTADAPVDFSAWNSMRLQAFIQGSSPNATVTALDMTTGVTGDAAGMLKFRAADAVTAFNAGNFYNANYGPYTFTIQGVKVALDTPQLLATGQMSVALAPQ